MFSVGVSALFTFLRIPLNRQIINYQFYIVLLCGLLTTIIIVQVPKYVLERTSSMLKMITRDVLLH